MNATVLHRSKGRTRLRLHQKYMTPEQADRLEAWLQKEPALQRVVVHERTCCVILWYAEENRSAALQTLAAFTWEKASSLTLTGESSRALNRAFQEKLVAKVLCKAACSLFLPKPLQIARIFWHAIPFLRRGLFCFLHRSLKVELLDGISLGISLFRRDFGTAGAVMFLLELGELLEEWTRKKSVADLARSMALHTDKVWARTSAGEVLLPVSQVQPGDHIILRAGAIIPLDSTVIQGEASVNQASLTGEPLPVAKHSGSTLYAGTVVEEGECVAEVKESSGHSRYEQIVSMIENSQQMKSAVESKAASLADKLVPYTFLGSILSLGLTRSLTRALSVLMVDFSCALKLAMPLAVLSAMGEAGKNHITVKGGKFLEAVAQADTIVFDKTGTLTFACPTVTQVIPFGDHTEEETLRLAACLEEHFPHSVANAVVEEARRRGLSHEEFHTKVEYLVAHGIVSTVEGNRVLIGSAHFIFEDEGCTIPAGDDDKFQNLPVHCSHLYLAVDKKLAAVLCIADPLRPEAKAVLSALRYLGVKNTVMLTGDSRRTAAVVAKDVGVDTFCAEVLPADKANYVEALKKEGKKVLMVGDGINDSPALSQADVGVAIREGAAIAREVADITISGKDLWELVTLRRIAMELMTRINRNYRFVIGFNGALILFGVLGFISPSLSATLHNVSTLGISLHSMSPLPNQLLPEDLKKEN
jgi:heavy metal translocating P-type ATPase